MKILVYSDLHLEFSGLTVPKTGYEVVLLAGDIHVGSDGAKWAKAQFPQVPVIYICGNHEFYNGEINDVIAKIRAECDGSNVHFCDDETIEIGDYRFICATLWSDFRLEGDAESSKQQAAREMNDYHVISYRDSLLKPADTEKFHYASRSFIQSQLALNPEKNDKAVVVTHHAPSRKSLLYERIDLDISPVYASSQDDLIKQYAPKLWVHGHTHESVDYYIETTRVLSNPRGYSFLTDGNGNSNFKQTCIIDI